MKIKTYFITLLTCFAFLVSACQPQPTAAPEPSPIPAPAATITPAPAPSPIPTETMRAQNPALIARLSELEGKVDIKQAGQAAFAPAKPDAWLEAQGQLQTGADGRSRLDLSTGTIVRVAPDSLFTLISNEEAAGGLFTKIKLELGKVFIILNGGNAEVQTPAGMAAVQGSYLKVEFDPAVGELTLTCLEGDCSVTTPGGGTKHFTDGQKITVHKDPATGEWIMDEGPMILEDFQEWLENNPEAKEKVERVKAILDADLRNAALTAMPNPQLPSLNLPDADKEKLKDLIDDPPFP